MPFENRLDFSCLWGSLFFWVFKPSHGCGDSCGCPVTWWFALNDSHLAPFEPFLHGFGWLFTTDLNDLGIKIGISQQHFLVIATLRPIPRQTIHSHHPFLQFLQLTQVIVPDFEVFLFWCDVLKTSVKTPVVLFHHVGHHYCTRAWLAVERVDQAALSLFHRLLDEVENGVDCVVLFIENLSLYSTGTFCYFSVQFTDKYWMPNLSHKFGIAFDTVFITCVTLLLITNSISLL